MKQVKASIKPSALIDYFFLKPFGHFAFTPFNFFEELPFTQVIERRLFFGVAFIFTIGLALGETEGFASGIFFTSGLLVTAGVGSAVAEVAGEVSSFDVSVIAGVFVTAVCVGSIEADALGEGEGVGGADFNFSIVALTELISL